MAAPDVASLEAANQAFYDAFETLDLDEMTRLWSPGGDVVCIHPGTDLIVGWPAVRRSWAAIFATTSYMQFIVTDVRARLCADAGWVTCTENVLTTAGHDDHLGSGKAVATNVFRWHRDRWLLHLHHGSPVLRTVQPAPPRGG